MLHAAIMGSIERFLSILIEHHAGAFPVWLAPTQVSLLPIADRHIEFCQQTAAQLEEKGIRVVIDDSAERLSKKIRNAQLEKVPYMLVVGDEEIESNQVGVRDRKEGDLGKMAVGAFVERVAEENEQKKV